MVKKTKGETRRRTNHVSLNALYAVGVIFTLPALLLLQYIQYIQ
jgi:hypothetical protein